MVGISTSRMGNISGPHLDAAELSGKEVLLNIE